MQVRIAWYSKAEKDRYHVCSNCFYNREIRYGNLIVGVEQDVRDELKIHTGRARLCERCTELIKLGYDSVFLLNVDS